MFWLIFSAVVTLFLQLPTTAIADSTVDAQNALSSFYEQINSSSTLVSFTVYPRWDAHKKTVPGLVDELLKNETDKFNAVLNKVTPLANYAVGGEECVDFLVNVTSVGNPIETEDIVFSNFYAIATKDIESLANQYNQLNDEFKANCLLDDINCAGISNSVLAEVERLLPQIKRVPYELQIEVDILLYRTLINLEEARTNLRQFYKKSIERATNCLATKIRYYRENEVNPAFEVPTDKGIGDTYQDLYVAVIIANSTSNLNLDFEVEDIEIQYLQDISEFSDAFFAADSRANDTIYSLRNAGPASFVATGCDFPFSIGTIFLDALVQFYEDTNRLVFDVLEGLLDKAANRIYDISNEIYSIELEVRGCPENPECDYVSEKIVAKKVEIPLRIRKVENSSIALFQQTVLAEREIGARAVRNALVQAEVVLLDYKSCIKESLQQL